MSNLAFYIFGAFVIVFAIGSLIAVRWSEHRGAKE